MDLEQAISPDYCMHLQLQHIHSTAFYTVQSTYFHVINNQATVIIFLWTIFHICFGK